MKDVILSAKHNATADEIAAVYFTAVTEPPKALKFHKLAGLTNESPVECIPVLVGIGMATGGVLRENEHSETGVKNLFAAGNVTGSGGSHGFTWACLIADHITQLVQDQKQLALDSEQIQQVEEAKKWVFSPLGRNGEYKVNPLELEII